MKKSDKRETIFLLCYLTLGACTYERSFTRFNFNSYSSFVNSLLQLILCDDGVHICKGYQSKVKRKVLCHAVVAGISY